MRINKLRSLINSSIALTAVCASNLLAQGTTIYHSQDDKSADIATGYSKTQQSSSRYLAYRDIPFFIASYANGTKTLDYGAGTGFSTQFLLSQNLDVTGVDISKEMLGQALINCPDTQFQLIQEGTIPAISGSYDLVFSSLVLFELGSEEDIVKYLEEAKRVMKNDAIFIAVTGSQDAYSKDWLIFNTDYPENQNLKSGDLAKIYLKDADIEFTDFYWTEADYHLFFSHAGLNLVEVHYPLGKEDEAYPWKDERTCSPFVILVAKKS